MHVRVAGYLCACLVVGQSLGADSTSAPHRILTFEDRVAAQRSIEGVYWKHRVWPKGNQSPKPQLSDVVSDSMLVSKVLAYDRRAAVLEQLLGPRQYRLAIEKEISRAVVHSRAPDILTELFAALHNDPEIIVETLGREILLDRVAT